MNGLKVAEVVVLEVQTEAEIQASIPSVDDLEVTELHGQGMEGCLYVRADM